MTVSVRYQGLLYMLQSLCCLLVVHEIEGFPRVPVGQMHLWLPSSGIHTAPMPHWVQTLTQFPWSQNSSTSQFSLDEHSIRKQPWSGFPVKPGPHRHTGFLDTTSQVAPLGQRVLAQTSTQVRCRQIWSSLQSLSNSQAGTGLQPEMGSPVVPGGHMQDAEWLRGWHIADEGQGLEDGRHGLRHCPL